MAFAFVLHPVGDYYAESDFYGGYAAGARLIQSGHLDPSRYPVVMKPAQSPEDTRGVPTSRHT